MRDSFLQSESSETTYPAHLAMGAPKEYPIYNSSQYLCPYLQEVCELAVAVGDVAGLGRQRCEHVTQCAQALVDAACLALAHVLHHGAV